MTYTDRIPYQGGKPVYITAKTIHVNCKSEMCRNKVTKHDFLRIADDGRQMYVCRECGEERAG